MCKILIIIDTDCLQLLEHRTLFNRKIKKKCFIEIESETLNFLEVLLKDDSYSRDYDMLKPWINNRPGSNQLDWGIELRMPYIFIQKIGIEIKKI